MKMMKRSLNVLAVVLLALASGMYWHFNGERLRTKSRFAAVGRDSTKAIDRSGPLRGIRSKDRIDFLQEMAGEYPCFSFDGRDRFCQIQPSGTKSLTIVRSGEGLVAMEADVLNVFRAKDRNGDTTFFWALPSGGRIARVSFLDDGVSLQVYGNMKLQRYGAHKREPVEYNISREKPVQIVIPWKAGDDRPPTPYIDLAISATVEGVYDEFLDAMFSVQVEQNKPTGGDVQ